MPNVKVNLPAAHGFLKFQVKLVCRLQVLTCWTYEGIPSVTFAGQLYVN